MSKQLRWSFLWNKLFPCLADSKCIGLWEEIRHKFIVIIDRVIDNSIGLLGFSESDELDRSDATLVQ